MGGNARQASAGEAETFVACVGGETSGNWCGIWSTVVYHRMNAIERVFVAAGGTFDSGLRAAWNDGDFGFAGMVDILDAADFLLTGRL